MCAKLVKRRLALLLAFVLVITMYIPSAKTSTVKAASQNGDFAVEGSGSSWGASFGYSVTITNQMGQAADSWKLIVDAPDMEITSIWCAKASVSGSQVTFTPEDWNQAIAADASVSFGFSANGTMPSMASYKVVYRKNGTEYTYISGTVASSAPVVTSAAPASIKPSQEPVKTDIPQVTSNPSGNSSFELNVSNSIAEGTYSSDFTVNGFTFIAGGSSWVVDSSNKTCNGVSYTRRAKSGGKGTTTKRAVAFDAKDAGTLVVHAMSGGSTNRNLTLNYNGNDIQSNVTVPSTVTESVFALPGAGHYVLYPSDDNVGIYYLKVTGGSYAVPSQAATQAPSKTPAPAPSQNANPVSGDIFVAPNANGSGTQSSPMSFTKALTSIQPGKTIYCLAGTYSYSQQITILYGNNGLQGKYKSIVAYNGANVVFDFSKEAYGDTASNARGIQLEGNYWRLYGLKIIGAADNGMMLSGNYNLIENCQFDGNRDTGLQVSRRNSSLSSMSDWPSYNTIKNCTSCNNMDPATGENADGFAAKLTCGPGNVFDGCIAYNNVDDGWDCYAKSATGPIGVLTIKNCIAFRNGETARGVMTPNSDGNGFKLGGSGVGTPHIVTNCISFENKNHGFTDNNNPTSLSIKNCTSFNNSRADGKKANFQMDRAGSGATYANLLSCSTNTIGSDKFKGTISNSVYYNSSKYYKVTGAAAISNNKVGTIVNAPSASDFESVNTPVLGTDVHKTWRNSDGSIKLGSFLKVKSSSAFYGMGAKF
ncbi:right-handed parallel beta-helix repeat-containing protein [[Clostridium] polysaccharolyticum]|uniref:Cellulose binding domain-containing protein n=1 Tax=[Clostridium] polysaccharolyticum TaxID=29364 RepID=A0A1H9ZE37_9FIRM|nr:cellulose binding domain-containing protein [[Clostridium] polysaccharolyticum]SES79817.1 Cellulose binding domain-containing protein [[Clostridium] polysaccharolyticum]